MTGVLRTTIPTSSILQAPDYTVNSVVIALTAAQVTSLNAGDHVDLPRMVGPHRVIFRWSTGGDTFTWAVPIEGGTPNTSVQVTPMDLSPGLFGLPAPPPATTTNPNTSYTVSGSKIPPLACTVQKIPVPTTMLPAAGFTGPTGLGSALTDRFVITTSQTSSAVELQLSYASTTNVPTKLSLLDGSSLADDVSVELKYYRSQPSVRSGGWKISMGAPQYAVRAISTTFDPSDGLPHVFEAGFGQQTIVVTYTLANNTPYYFSFDMDWGVRGLTNAIPYLGMLVGSATPHPTGGNEGCTVESLTCANPYARTASGLLGVVVTAVAASTPRAGFVTYTTSGPHGLQPGTSVVVEGVTPAGYAIGGSKVQAAPTPTTFTVRNTTTGAAVISTGAIRTAGAYHVGGGPVEQEMVFRITTTVSPKVFDLRFPLTHSTVATSSPTLTYVSGTSPSSLTVTAYTRHFRAV